MIANMNVSARISRARYGREYLPGKCAAERFGTSDLNIGIAAEEGELPF
jgi:hypothetical protein